MIDEKLSNRMKATKTVNQPKLVELDAVYTHCCRKSNIQLKPCFTATTIIYQSSVCKNRFFNSNLQPTSNS